tara:strand:+ start:152 stop:451 length:300 start_codon:yes stop_codon:yes gene_type:complete
MAIKAKWEEYQVTWENATEVWEGVFLEVVKQVGDSNQAAIIDGLEPKKVKKLISLVCKRDGIKIYEESKESIKAKITVDSIQFALEEVSKPSLEIIDAI